MRRFDLKDVDIREQERMLRSFGNGGGGEGGERYVAEETDAACGETCKEDDNGEFVEVEVWKGDAHSCDSEVEVLELGGEGLVGEKGEGLRRCSVEDCDEESGREKQEEVEPLDLNAQVVAAVLAVRENGRRKRGKGLVAGKKKGKGGRAEGRQGDEEGEAGGLLGEVAGRGRGGRKGRRWRGKGNRENVKVEGAGRAEGEEGRGGNRDDHLSR